MSALAVFGARALVRASSPSNLFRTASRLGPHRRHTLLPCQSTHKPTLARRYASEASVSSVSSITPPPPPPRRSLPSRFLRTIGLALLFIPLGFTMATIPIAPAINELVNPPSDAESIAAFQPYDARSGEINSYILTHPLAQSLRADASFTESRPFMKLPPAAQQHHLTSGALGGAGKLWVPPLTFAQSEGRSIVILLYLGRDLCGHPGIVHGGMLATLLDEGLAKCCFQALPHKVGMTANLTVDYRAPTPADTFVVLRGTTTKVEGRKAWVEGRIEEMDPPEGREPVVFATAKGLFVEPKQAATMARLYPAAAG